jgi:hypothetical protein
MALFGFHRPLREEPFLDINIASRMAASSTEIEEWKP